MGSSTCWSRIGINLIHTELDFLNSFWTVCLVLIRKALKKPLEIMLNTGIFFFKWKDFSSVFHFQIWIKNYWLKNTLRPFPSLLSPVFHRGVKFFPLIWAPDSTWHLSEMHTHVWRQALALWIWICLCFIYREQSAVMIK